MRQLDGRLRDAIYNLWWTNNQITILKDHCVSSGARRKPVEYVPGYYNLVEKRDESLDIIGKETGMQKDEIIKMADSRCFEDLQESIVSRATKGIAL